MAVVSNLKLRMTADVAQFERGTKKASNVVTRLKSDVQTTSLSLTSLIGPLAGVGTAFFGVSAAIKAVSGGFNRANMSEQATVAFETMIGSADKAKKTLLDIEAFAAATPFQLPELVDAGKKLLAFGTSADQVVPSLRMIGDLAAGLNIPIGELSEIYGKAMTQGRLQMEDINQLSGRGIPIIQELATQFGVATSEVRKMVEKGQVGFPHMQKAFANLTANGGKFGGMMEKQSQTVSGLMSTVGDNIGAVLARMAAGFMEAFNVRQMLAGLSGAAEWFNANVVPSLVSGFQGIAQGVQVFARWVIAAVTPIVQWFQLHWPQIWNVVSAYLGMVQGIVTQVFTFISSFISAALEGISSFFVAIFGGSMTTTFTNWSETITFGLAVIEWAYRNWQTVLGAAVLQVQLWIVQFGEEVIHTLTVRIPAVLVWFGNNWQEIFNTIGNFTVTLFGNLWKNISSFFSSLWTWISTRGKSGWTGAWTPLLEGFENTIKELPNIAEREIGPLEKGIAADLAGVQKSMGESLSDFTGKRMDEFKKRTEETTKAVVSAPAAAAKVDPLKLAEKMEDQSKKNEQASKSLVKTSTENKALEFGTAEAFSAVRGAGTKAITNLQEKQLAELRRIAAQKTEVPKTVKIGAA